jgi:hypothetical protein
MMRRGGSIIKRHDEEIERLAAEISTLRVQLARADELPHEEKPSDRRLILPDCLPSCRACATRKKLMERATKLKQRRAGLLENVRLLRREASRQSGKNGGNARTKNADPRKRLTLDARDAIMRESPGTPDHKLVSQILEYLERRATPASRTTVLRHLKPAK